MATVSKEPGKTTRIRTDGRRTLLVYLDADLIKNLKRAALDDEKTVYEIVEEASRVWLKGRAAKARRTARKGAVGGR